MEQVNKGLHEEFANRVFGWAGVNTVPEQAQKCADDLVEMAEKHFAEITKAAVQFVGNAYNMAVLSDESVEQVVKMFMDMATRKSAVQQPTSDLRETFKNLLIDSFATYTDNPAGSMSSKLRILAKRAGQEETCAHVADQLMQEVERHEEQEYDKLLSEARPIEEVEEEMASHAEPIKVIAIVRDGLVQAVNIPEGIELEVRDYDVDGTPKRELETDSDGGRYYLTCWYPSESDPAILLPPKSESEGAE